MDNPFLRRTSERLRDEEAFLSIVSPQPVQYFLGRAGESDLLYNCLVFVTGTPGSGKTTLARLFEYPTIAALLRNKNIETHSDLVSAMLKCRAIEDKAPQLLGYRLPMESDYRDFWEFPYEDNLKISLMTSLIQARAVLGWMRHLQTSGISLENVRVVPHSASEAAIESIGGTEAIQVFERARVIEKALYAITGSLVPPNVSSIPINATGAYQPFDIIDHFCFQVGVPDSVAERTLNLKPLVLLDDAWVLHPKQFEGLQHWLKRREMRVARWILTRLDVLHPREALQIIAEERPGRVQLQGITSTREVTHITMFQSQGDNRLRYEFRKMAKDMANRYLRFMPLFNDRGLVNLGNLLQTDDRPINQGELAVLTKQVDAARRKLKISATRHLALQAEVGSYRNTNQHIAEDLRLAMLHILMHREAKRRAKTQGSLFDDQPDELAEQNEDRDEVTFSEALPSKLPTAKLGVLDAARIFLLHQFDRPYYYGIDVLCDASSENAEQFLHLAAVLVEDIGTRIARGRESSLDATTQNRRLRESATNTIQQWNFAYSNEVRRLVTELAALCVQKTLEENAPLGHGANTFGVPQEEFNEIFDKHSELAKVLQSAVAHNTLFVTPNYSCKNRLWCLLELGGMVVLKHGLPLKRGGFVEGHVQFLIDAISEENA